MPRTNVEVGASLAPGFKGTLKSATGAVAGMAADMQGPLRDIANGASAGQASFNLFREFLLTRFLGPLGTLVVTLGGASAAMWLFNKASGAAARGLQQFSTIEDLEGQFRPLLGTVAATKARLAELADFAAKTPFELPETAAASKTLEVLTRGALATGDGLRMIGDLAAQSGRPFQELAMWVGRLYDGLQSGRPVGEAMMRLQELGLVSGDTRTKIEELQKAGKAGNEVWQVMVKEFDRAKGSMDILSGSISGLRSTMEDAKKALYREMGKSFAEQEKEAIKGATEVTEKFTPIAAEMMKTLSGAGLAQVPGQWVPFYDKELKQFLVTVLSARETVLGLWKALVVLGAGFVVATLAGAVTSMISAVMWMKKIATEAKAVATAKTGENQQWQWSVRYIKANTVALSENLQAAGRSRAAAVALGASMTVGRTIAGYFANSLRAVGAAFLNPITLILMAATAVWQWVNSLEEANKKAAELNQTYNETAVATAKQIAQIKTLAEKAAFLASQYEELKKVRDRLSSTEDAKEVQHLKEMEQLIQVRIRQSEALKNSELKAGQDRQKLIDDLKAAEKEYADSKLKDAEKLLAKEKEISDMQAKKAELAKAAEDAEKKASAESIAEIDKQIAAQQRLRGAAKAKLDEIAERAGGSDNTAAAVAGFGVMVPRGAPGDTEAKGQAEAALAEAESKIAALQQSKEGRTATEETTKTALQEKQNALRALEIEAEKLRETVKLAEQKARTRAAELYTEAQILALQSTGSQRVADEIALRQKLLALKIREADAEGKTLEAAELRGQFAENEKRLFDNDKERNQKLSEERQQRMDAREEQRIERLPKKEQAAALKKKENDLNAEALKLEQSATAARKAGRDAEADDLELKAEGKRGLADRAGFRADDILRQGKAQPIVSSLARLGGAAGEASTYQADTAKNQLDEVRKLRADLGTLKTEVVGLRADMKTPPDWDKTLLETNY